MYVALYRFLQLIEDNGKGVYLHFIRLIVQAWQTGQGSPNSDYIGSPIHKLLIEQLQVLAKTQSDAALFSEAVSSTEKSEALKSFDFELFIRESTLKPIEKTRLALALLQSPKPDLVSQGKNDRMDIYFSNTLFSADASMSG